MPVFAYVARDQGGREVKGTTEADTQESLVIKLRNKGLVVSAVTRQSGMVRKTDYLAFFKRVGLKDLSLFCRQFATMIDAGVSLIRALTVLEHQTGNSNLRSVIRRMQARVEEGTALSRAMQEHPAVFSNLAVGLVRAGEVGGVLDEVLERLATFIEKDVELRRKVRSALTYPIIVICIAFGIVIGLVTFIIPKFIALFDDFGVAQMPGPTQLLINASHFMTSKTAGVPNLAVLFGGIFVFYLLFRAAIRTRLGSRIWDIFKLKLPVFGKLSHKVALARFSRTLSTLMDSGVPILQALETVAGAVGNVLMADAIMKARASIREGDEIATPLASSKLFPPMVVHMISVGEETGALSQMLSKIADFYDSEVQATLESLTAALEPVLIVFLGGMVGFIVIAMFLPLIAMIQSLTTQSGT